MSGTLGPTPFPQPQGRVTQPTGCGVFPWQYDRRTTPPGPDAEVRKGAESRYNVVALRDDAPRRTFPGIRTAEAVDR